MLWMNRTSYISIFVEAGIFQKLFMYHCKTSQPMGDRNTIDYYLVGRKSIKYITRVIYIHSSEIVFYKVPP